MLNIKRVTSILIDIVLIIGTSACGRQSPPPKTTIAPSPTAMPIASTPTPAQAAMSTSATEPGATPTSPTDAYKVMPDAQENAKYDTVFPLPDDVKFFSGEGGDSRASFQTGLSFEELIEFYRKALTEQGLTEHGSETKMDLATFTIVFDGWPSGKALVISGMKFVEGTNVTIRLENR